jgi:hypothetical protein
VGVGVFCSGHFVAGASHWALVSESHLALRRTLPSMAVLGLLGVRGSRSHRPDLAPLPLIASLLSPSARSRLSQQAPLLPELRTATSPGLFAAPFRREAVPIYPGALRRRLPGIELGHFDSASPLARTLPQIVTDELPDIHWRKPVRHRSASSAVSPAAVVPICLDTWETFSQRHIGARTFAPNLFRSDQVDRHPSTSMEPVPTGYVHQLATNALT